MLKQIALMIFLGFSINAFAANEQVLETCALDTSMSLTQITQIFCDQDLNVKDGVEIVTNGFGLQIVAMGRVFFGTQDGLGTSIRAESQSAGLVHIYARTASGQLRVENEAADFGGDVQIEYGSTYDYVQTLKTNFDAAARTVVNGQTLQ